MQYREAEIWIMAEYMKTSFASSFSAVDMMFMSASIFYIAVMHFGVWLLIYIYAIKIKQKLICIAVYYAACLILWDDLHFKTNSYNII